MVQKSFAASKDILLLDTFTDPDDTNIPDHTPNFSLGGITWQAAGLTGMIVNNRYSDKGNGYGNDHINLGVNQRSVEADVWVPSIGDQIIIRLNSSSGGNVDGMNITVRRLSANPDKLEIYTASNPPGVFFMTMADKDWELPISLSWQADEVEARMFLTVNHPNHADGRKESFPIANNSGNWFALGVRGQAGGRTAQLDNLKVFA